MSDERVDVVARTLFVEDVPGIFEPSDWDSLSEAGRDEFRRIARAVLDAISQDARSGGSDA